jgi:hypothetical protein
MRGWLVLLVLGVLAGCGSAEGEVRPRRSTLKERQEAAEVLLQRTPVPRTYRFADGELRVMEVPVKDGGGFVDSQRCFVWRDEAYRSASISCGQMPEVLLNGGLDGR